MVRRNHHENNASHFPNDGLVPCRQPVDAREAKRALTAFIAACGKAAAAATIAMAVGTTHVEAQEQSLGGRQPIAEIVPMGGVMAPVELTTQPAKKDSAKKEPAKKPQPKSREAGSDANVYVVVAGDTLWKISEKHLGSGAKYKALIDANPGLTADIKPGQKIKIPAQSASAKK